MKKSKKDQKKIVAFYIKKYEEYYKMNSNDLVLLQDQKMSSTQKLALRDAINQKMKEEIMNQRMKDMEEKEAVEEKPIIDLNKVMDGMGQQYKKITDASFADIIIVGRGIYEASDIQKKSKNI